MHALNTNAFIVFMISNELANFKLIMFKNSFDQRRINYHISFKEGAGLSLKRLFFEKAGR